MLFTVEQQLSFLAAHLGISVSDIITIDSHAYLGIFQTIERELHQVNRWLLIEDDFLYYLIKNLGKCKFINDFITDRDALYSLEELADKAKNSQLSKSEYLAQLEEQFQAQQDCHEKRFQLILKYAQAATTLDISELFKSFSGLSPLTANQFDFSAHSSFYWDAIALEYFCDTDGIYGTTLHELFPTELTPSFPASSQLSWHRFPNHSFNFDFLLRSLDNCQYVILGRQTVYHLPPDFIDSQPGFSETAPSDFSALSSNELRLSRHAGAAYEKLRRCLIAMIHFNDYSATNKQQKWAINQSSLQRLSGCNRDALKKFLVEHEKLVNHHNSLHGLTERHNTGKGRAGLKIEQVIFW